MSGRQKKQIARKFIPKITIGVHGAQGPREKMEDVTHSVALPKTATHPELQLCALFDGHNGVACAQFLKENLPEALDARGCFKLKPPRADDPAHPQTLSPPLSTSTSPPPSPGNSAPFIYTPPDPALLAECEAEEIKKAFLEIDNKFLDMAKEQNLKDGSTAVIAWVMNTTGVGTSMVESEDTVQTAVWDPARLIVAHVGDSRAVLNRDGVAVRLTKDHKPADPEEKARVVAAGGRVLHLGGMPRVGGTLAISRCFGDINIKDPKPVVDAMPDVRVEVLTPKDSMVILASDGLWDMVKDQEAVDIAATISDVDEACKTLAETALKRGSKDNTSVLILSIKWKEETTSGGFNLNMNTFLKPRKQGSLLGDAMSHLIQTMAAALPASNTAPGSPSTFSSNTTTSATSPPTSPPPT